MSSTPPSATRSIRWRESLTGGNADGVETSLAIRRDVTDAFAYTRRAITDQLREWRRGNYNWDEAKRQPEIAAVVHPKPGGWDFWDLTDPFAAQAGGNLLGRIRANRRVLGGGAAGAGGPEETFAQFLRMEDLDGPGPMVNDPAFRTERVRAVQAATNVLNARFGPTSFRRVRPLSTGGESLVFLYSMEDQRRRTHNIVVKVDPGQSAVTTTNEIRVLKVSTLP